MSIFLVAVEVLAKDREKKKPFTIETPLQWILNASLVVLSVVLIWLLGKEIVHLVDVSLFGDTQANYKELLKGILTFFLYFEFLSMIMKYFKDNYHFPLRYFMYIGITATIRYIVVDHEDAQQTFYLSGAILLMVMSYGIIKVLSKKDS